MAFAVTQKLPAFGDGFLLGSLQRMFRSRQTRKTLKGTQIVFGAFKGAARSWRAGSAPVRD